MRAAYPLVLLILALQLTGCGTASSDGITPDERLDGIENMVHPAVQFNTGVHQLWGYYAIHSEDLEVFEIIPLRNTEAHYNVRTFM